MGEYDFGFVCSFGGMCVRLAGVDCCLSVVEYLYYPYTLHEAHISIYQSLTWTYLHTRIHLYTHPQGFNIYRRILGDIEAPDQVSDSPLSSTYCLRSCIYLHTKMPLPHPLFAYPSLPIMYIKHHTLDTKNHCTYTSSHLTVYHSYPSSTSSSAASCDCCPTSRKQRLATCPTGDIDILYM